MRHNFLLSAPVLALLLTLTTLLAACSSDDPTATPTRPAANDPTPTQPDPTATPTPSEPRVIRYAVASFGEENLDPTQTSISSSVGVLGPLWDWMTLLQPDGSLAPGLALSWEQAADGMSWTFEMRQGVKFHNGDELTAEDVRFTYMEAYPREEANASRKGQFAAGITDVEVVSTYTARIITANPWPTLPYDISNQPGIEGVILPKNYVDTEGWEHFGRNPVGTGPWKFVAHETGNFIEYEAFEDYWGGAPEYDQLRMLVVPELSTRSAMLRRDEVDIADISLDQAGTLKDAGFTVAEDPQRTSLRVHLYGTYYGEPGYDGEGYTDPGPTKHLAVRKALNLAINRQEIVDALFEGRGAPAAVFPVSSISIGYPADLEPYPYDPEQARQLMQDAGFASGFDIKLFTFPQGSMPAFLEVAEAVAGYWDAIGVRAEIVPTDIGAFRPLYNAQPQPAELTGQASTFASTGRLNGRDGLPPWWNVSRKLLALSPNMDEYFTRASEAPTVEEIGKAVQEGYHVVYDNYRSVPIANVSGALWAYGNSLAGVNITILPLRGFIAPWIGRPSTTN